MLARMRLLTIIALALALTSPAAHAAGDLNATANATSSTQIEIQWQWYEYDPSLYPIVGRPDWVGYDLYRRNPAECSAWVRLNAEIIPRAPGVSHGGTYVDTPPATLLTWEYKLVMVDAAHGEIVLVWPEGCEPPCNPHMWESIPKLAGPVTVGTVGLDVGWAVYIDGCPDGCWAGGFYVEGPAADPLRPYVGTGQAFRFYGDESFGTFEGNPLSLDRFEATDCGSTPAERPTWGRIKTLYR
jgi:hypothetical protein